MKFDKFTLVDEETELSITDVTILTTGACNNKCWYCAIRKDKEPRSITVDDWHNIVDFIFLQKRKKVQLRFSGGECTTHPLLPQFVEAAHRNLWPGNVEISVLTNLNQPLEYYRTYLYLVDWFLISYHSGWVRDKNEWFRKALELQKYHDIYISLMLEWDNAEEILHLYNMYKHDFKYIKVMPINEIVGSEYYDGFLVDYEGPTEAVEILEEYEGSPDVIPYLKGFEHHRNFKGMFCSSGFIVDEYGGLWYCWQDMACGDGPIMNIFEEEPKKVPQFHVCKRHHCYDGYYYPKYSLRYFAENIK